MSAVHPSIFETLFNHTFSFQIVKCGVWHDWTKKVADVMLNVWNVQINEIHVQMLKGPSDSRRQYDN